MSRQARQGITLVEVLIVVAIIAILIGLMLPAMRNVGVAASRMKCANNLKQLMLGLHAYEDTSGTLPIYFPRRFPAGCIGPGEDPEERLSWMVALLPFVEQDSLYQHFKLEKGYAGNSVIPSYSRVSTYQCPTTANPSKGHEGSTSYIALAGLGTDAARQPLGYPGNGFMGYDRPTNLSMFKDGSSHTIALMETAANLGTWARGGSSTVRGFEAGDLPWCGEKRPWGGSHARGLNVAMADGSVRFLSDSLDAARVAAAVTIAGGELEKLD